MKYFIPLLFTAVFFTAAAQATPCVNPAGDEGDQVYNITYHVMQYCNGSHWVAMGSVMGQGDNLGDHNAVKALDMRSFRIENLAPPSASADAATKAYVDAEDAKKVSKSGDAMTGHLSLSGAPTANTHATSKEYVDTVVASAAGGTAVSCTPVLTTTTSCSCPSGFPVVKYTGGSATSVPFYAIDPISNLGGTEWAIWGSSYSNTYYLTLGIPAYGVVSGSPGAFGKYVVNYSSSLTPYCAKLCCHS